MPDILVPKWKTVPFTFERELRTGGLLHEKLRRERGDTKRRLKAAALPHKDYQRPRGSEFDLKAVVDLRTWFRWWDTDSSFWSDMKNIERFVRDNPEVAPWRQ